MALYTGVVMTGRECLPGAWTTVKVAWVIMPDPTARLSRARTGREESGYGEMFMEETRALPMKFPMAPESTREVETSRVQPTSEMGTRNVLAENDDDGVLTPFLGVG